MSSRDQDPVPVRPRGADRVPPHDLQAEESLLGAMMLEPEAIAVAAGTVRADDFYKPAHAHIFDAIHALYAVGQPVDPVTVADELRRNGLLETVGGHQALVRIMSSTPATSNASGYARILEEHALLRKLIAVAGELAEMGYSMPEDVTKALDRAESLVYEVNQRRVTDTTAKIEELLGLNLDRLEQLYGRGDAITGVPTGYSDVDELLSGLQPSALVVVGARPAMGKALALDTPLPTPDGWTTMGDVAVGDQLFDEQGRPCTVTYVTPVQHERTCYEVEFDDGSVIVADADHQWFAYDMPTWKSLRERHYRRHGGHSAGGARHPNLARDRSSRHREPRVITTREMVDEGVRAGDGGRPNWYIPLAGSLTLPEADLPVDPYVLGCWLGDGCSTSSEMTIGDLDLEHFRAEFAAAGYPLAHRTALQYATVPVEGAGSWQSDTGPDRVLTRELREVGLLGGATKHIPDAYLRASARQRVALVQGLLDTDGGVTNNDGTVELCLSNRSLLQQAHELVCSLGHKPGPIRSRTISLPDGRNTTAWRFAWTPLSQVFRLERKATRGDNQRSHRTFGRMTRRAIRAIRPVGSVPVRCITVDSPNHLYLAGETMVPTHNTSFALGMASHAALYADQPVLLFSLEMGSLELSQRLLCAEARIDSARVRTGRLAEDDWTRVSQAIGQLASAPIWIDDNPNLTVMEIRAKARRLKSQTGQLGMIVVDYLQLMTGRGSAENRQVEVSEMSRGLKILARELECPVVALSQLSRQLEMRADKRPMLADLRESGCLTADARVLRADTGAEVTIGELARSGEKDIPVWSLDTDLRMVPSTMTHAFSTGVKETFDLRLASGRTVRASANHPFLTLDGWLRLDELQEGSRIAVPREIPAPKETREWPAGTGAAPLREHLAGISTNTNVDTVPVEIWAHIRDVMTANGVTTRQLATGLEMSSCGSALYKSALSRERTLKVAEVLDDDHLRRLATSDVFWDRVVAIEPRGEEEVFDATVESTHNFIANGIVVENSIEQDADVVMFLYRDDVYNPDSPDRGQAEVIVAKHRNGPTGTCRLAFLEQYTRFANMARIE